VVSVNRIPENPQLGVARISRIACGTNLTSVNKFFFLNGAVKMIYRRGKDKTSAIDNQLLIQYFNVWILRMM
jgi:hypothetical protein